MIIPKCVLIFGFILTLLLDPILCKKGFGGHSYPKSGGLSGGGHRTGGLSGGGHGYPSSGGSHSYPSSGGSHSYPSSGGSHTYPSSGGSHNYPSLSGNNKYPSHPVSSGGTHTYPSSGNNHGYPSSNGGLSGNNRNHPPSKPAVHHTTHTTHVYNNYRYTPPAQISYASVRGAPPVNYPVYHGKPPTYVYEYKNSNSKYGTLLAGLALMNLGTLGVAAYAVHKAGQNHGSSGTPTYTPQKGEVCKFAIRKENGDYEETRIDCQIISGFILQDMEAQKANTGTNSTITTVTTVTNVTMVNITNGGSVQTTTAAPVRSLYEMLSNGTLVPINTTGVNIPAIPGVVDVTQNATANNSGSTSSVVTTTTTTNTTLVSALDVKGKPVEVTPGMQCFVIRNSPLSNMKKSVPCGLLQTYADKSIRRNSAARNMPLFTVIAAILAYCVAS